jgi:hypothetical protein
MPLDMSMKVLNAPVPAHLSFPLHFEHTKWDKMKYVQNAATDEYIGIVGKDFTCVDHKKFFEDVQQVMVETLPEEELTAVDVRWRSARKNAWAMMDLQLTGVAVKIENEKFSTTIMPRIIALHGVDGSQSNQVYFGKIDAFCTNGMINGTFDQVKRKNTSGFNMEDFKKQLRKARQDFYKEAQTMNTWLNTEIPSLTDIEDLIEQIVGKERKSQQMTDLYWEEAGVRGHNVFSLYSAFTNYATDDVRSGMPLRNTKDKAETASESMWKREQEVSKWISSPAFQGLLKTPLQKQLQTA